MRSRVALIAALAVVLAVLLLSGTAYVVVSHDLVGGVDGTLTARAVTLQQERVRGGLAAALDKLFQPVSSLSRGPVDQVVEPSGLVVAPAHNAIELPVSAEVRQVAAGRVAQYFASTTVGRTPVRMFVTSFGSGLALEVAQPVGGVNAELKRLAFVLAEAAIGGVVVAVLLGAGVAGIVLRPVRRLTHAAEQLAVTRDLAQRIPVEGRDELSRLATSINTVIGALQNSQLGQRQLIADASHELRTPLTSLRTNVEILAGSAELAPRVRQQLVEDVVGQLDRLGLLVGDLIELARQDGMVELGRSVEVIAFDQLVDDVLAGARRDHPRIRIEQSLSPTLVSGVRGDLERLVANLVDNAAKWSLAGGLVKVTLRNPPAVLTVKDHGRGIDPDDVPHVFDRFFRGGGGERVPGSGLGLAIVQRIVEVHGGAVSVASVRGEGTSFEVRLPSASAVVTRAIARA